MMKPDALASGLLEVQDLHTNLVEMLMAVRTSSVPSFATMKAIVATLDKGTVFSILTSIPPWESTSKLAYDSYLVLGVYASIMCLWSIHELAKANKLCGPLLAKLPPDIWEAVVRWLEFIHPMHDHLRPCK